MVSNRSIYRSFFSMSNLGNLLIILLKQKGNHFMYKTGSSRSLFYKQKQNKGKFSFLWFITLTPLCLVIILIIAEMLTRSFFDITGKTQELKINPQESKELLAYRLEFLNENEQPYELISHRGSLRVKKNLSSGYEIINSQKNEYWQINEQGFRDNDPLPLQKPKNEIRIFLLGGSIAFGHLSPNNQSTIAHQLEQKLQQRVQQQQANPESYRPDVFPFFQPLREKLMVLPAKIKQGEYRVINAAVPGYSSGNQLSQLALEILPYQPDLIIILDGYADLMLPSNRQATEIPKLEQYLQNASGHFQAYLNDYVNDKLEQIYLLQLAKKSFPSETISPVHQSLVVKEEELKSLSAYLPQDEQELKQRIERYRKNQQNIFNLCVTAGIPLIFVLQPEITGKSPNKLSDAEKSILQELGTDYQNKVKNEYPQLAKPIQKLEKSFPKNIKTLNLYQLNDKYPVPSFVDAIHLTQEANQVMAEQIYYSIAGLEKMQIIPQYFYFKENK